MVVTINCFRTRTLRRTIMKFWIFEIRRNAGGTKVPMNMSYSHFYYIIFFMVWQPSLTIGIYNQRWPIFVMLHKYKFIFLYTMFYYLQTKSSKSKCSNEQFPLNLQGKSILLTISSTLYNLIGLERFIILHNIQ